MMANELTEEEALKVEEIICKLRERDIDGCIALSDLPPPNRDILREALKNYVDVVDLSGSGAYSASADGFSRDGTRFLRIHFRSPPTLFLSMISELHQGRRVIRLTNMATEYVVGPASNMSQRSLESDHWSGLALLPAREIADKFMNDEELAYIEDAVKAVANDDRASMARLSNGNIEPDSPFWRKLELVDHVLPLVDEKHRAIARVDDGYYLVSQRLYTERSEIEPSDVILEFEIIITNSKRRISIITVYVS